MCAGARNENGIDYFCISKKQVNYKQYGRSY